LSLKKIKVNKYNISKEKTNEDAKEKNVPIIYNLKKVRYEKPTYLKRRYNRIHYLKSRALY
jgi:hypothetical protein